MKILHIIPAYIPAWHSGGPIRSVHGLCKALVNLGHDVHVFTTDLDGNKNINVMLGQPIEREGVKIWYFSARFLKRITWAPQMAVKLKQTVKDYDIVHLHSIFRWPTSMAAKVIGRSNVPYIYAPRGSLVKELFIQKNKWIKLIWMNLVGREILEKAAAIHVTSYIEKTKITEFGLDLPDIYIVPNGVSLDNSSEYDRSTMQTKLEKMPDEFILFLGRINWEKGLKLLFHAFSYIPNENLVLAGINAEGYQRTLEKLATKLGILSRVHFFGHANEHTKRNLLKNAKILVLTSFSENFGLVILEAMSESCPVVVTEGVGAAEIIEKHKTGIVCSSDPLTIASSLKRLCEDPHLRKNMGKAGKRLIDTQYNWNVISKKMVNVYKQIINSNQKY